MSARKMFVATVLIAMVLLPITDAGVIFCPKDSDFQRLYNAAVEIIGSDYDWEIINFSRTDRDPIAFANASS
ncbi:MAG: hypothetical protein QXL15_04265, partial [Candidatus Korarchaeota archaeon]